MLFYSIISFDKNLTRIKKMINYQENKNVIFSGLITILVFFILYLLNFQTLKGQNYFLTEFLSHSFQGIYLFFTFVILPSLVFIFLQIILLKYLNLLWATSISAVSVFSYVEYDFKQFIYDLIFSYDSIKTISSKNIILLDHPNITFSLFIFLFLTWICLKLQRFKLTHVVLVTVLWSCFSWISFSGSIIGLLFWTIYSSIRIYRLNVSLTRALGVGTFNLLFYILYFYLFKSFILIDGSNVNNIYNFTLGYFLFYFVVPIISILLIYYFYKIDFYEILIKFTPIYVLMLSDLIISFYLAKYNISYQNHEYFIYPHFILHFLYIIPIIYYLAKPLSPFVENKKTRKNLLKKYIFIFFSKGSKIYLPIIILTLYIFAILPGRIAI